MTGTVSARDFYSTYHGHETELLTVLLHALREDHQRVIFLAGDSSLDNKYWFNDTSPAINGYERVLVPPRMKQDVAYWLNWEAVRRGEANWCCLNTAVEATSLNSRAMGNLLRQDAFIRDHITDDDVLVVSLGGNDIALNPLLCTILNLSLLVCCTPQYAVENCACSVTPNICCLDCGCLCCGLPGCLNGLLSWPLGFGYFVDLFKNRVENYVRRLVSKRKPGRVVVCMIYYPDESGRGSWADPALRCMGYNCAPARLQCAIQKIFQLATSRIRIPGTEVLPFALHEVLDGRDTNDYVQRVEPSPAGGHKMAQALMDAILGDKLAG